MGYAQGRTGWRAYGSREPRELSRCERRRDGAVYGELGFDTQGAPLSTMFSVE